MASVDIFKDDLTAEKPITCKDNGEMFRECAVQVEKLGRSEELYLIILAQVDTRKASDSLIHVYSEELGQESEYQSAFGKTPISFIKQSN